MALPRLYDDLAWIWPFLSPPEEYTDEVATFFEEFDRLGVPEGGRLLHLGSGGGSIDWHLKQRYKVTGIDLSAAMLAQAQAVNPEARYLVGDLRNMHLGRHFDAVLLHDAVAYMLTPDELRDAYRTAAAHLVPGGALVTTPEMVRECFQQHHSEVVTREDGGRSVTTLIVDFDPDPSDHQFESTFIYLIRDAGALRVEVDTHQVGIHALADFEAAIAAAGFSESRCRWVDGYPLISAVRR
jgi:SAM-dependent methyltransferase